MKYNRIQQQTYPFYNIQSNPEYAELFAYVGPHVRDRNLYIKDCDDETPEVRKNKGAFRGGDI